VQLLADPRDPERWHNVFDKVPYSGQVNSVLKQDSGFKNHAGGVNQCGSALHQASELGCRFSVPLFVVNEQREKRGSVDEHAQLR
jgi:hypothetical protein